MTVAAPQAPNAAPQPCAQAWDLAAQLSAPALGLGGSVLWEPSCRLSAGALIENRFLLCVPAPGPGVPVTGLLAFLAGLGLPAPYLPLIKAKLPDAVHLHLGVEPAVAGHGGAGPGQGGGLYKFYLEFPRTGLAVGAAPGSPPLTYLAVKWDPQRPQRHVLTRYHDCPVTDAGELARRLAGLCGPGAAAVAVAATSLVAHTSRALPVARMSVLEVREEGNPRSSFDLGLYDADLRLGDLGDWLGTLWRHFGLPLDACAALLARGGHSTLGHFAGGVGRDGAEFCTLYYGVGWLVGHANAAPPR